jgi:hypothetical protein
VAERPKVITASEMDKMSPQERADAVDASVRRNWDEVDPGFRDRTLAEARRLNAQLRDG